ncbi:MAG: nucleotide exchange factor GrpE [Gammaproteobacteria bacterium]|jgi:molecular chaperone GrpE
MNEHAADARQGQADTGDAAQSESGSGQDQPSERSEVDSLREELDQARDQYLRLAAELDNVRKRSEREIENAHRYGIERFAQALLPVLDSFEAALNAENLELDTLLEGQRATLRLLEQAFRDAGIAPIDPTGEPFDPQLHEAMSMLVSPTAEPNSVVDVVQKGYALHTRLLRPARVVVAAAPESSSDD